MLRVATDEDAPVELDEQEALADALVALRRAANCQSLPGHVRRALEAGADLLARYVDPRHRRGAG